MAGTGVDPDFGPILIPISLVIRGGIRGENGAVEGFVGVFEPGGAFVVEFGKGAVFQPCIFCGGGHDRGMADERPCFGGYVGKIVGGVDAGGERV